MINRGLMIKVFLKQEKWYNLEKGNVIDVTEIKSFTERVFI